MNKIDSRDLVIFTLACVIIIQIVAIVALSIIKKPSQPMPASIEKLPPSSTALESGDNRSEIAYADQIAISLPCESIPCQFFEGGSFHGYHPFFQSFH